MSASVCTFYEILLTFFSASAPTELPSAGTPFTRCWQPGRRRCHPWRDIRGTRLSGRCIWQNKGRGVCLPFLGHCRGHDQGLPLTSPRLFSRIHNRSDFWTLQARKQKTGKHAGFLDKSLGWAPPLTSCLNVLLSLSAFVCALSMRPEGSVTVQLRVPFWRHVKTTQFSYTLHTYTTSQQAYFHGVLPRRTHCFNSAGLTECGTPTRIFLTVWKKSKDLFWRALICFGNTCLFLQLLLSSPLEPFVVCFCRIKCSDRSCKGAAMRGREGYNLPTVSDFFSFFNRKKKTNLKKKREKSCHSGDCYHVQRLYRAGWLGSSKQLKRCIQRHDGGPGWAVFVCETAEKASACLGGDASRGLWACLSLWAFEVWGF